MNSKDNEFTSDLIVVEMTFSVCPMPYVPYARALRLVNIESYIVDSTS